MALLKEIVQSDGVITDYHRILFIQTTVNRQNSIALLSYINSNTRTLEKENTNSHPYIHSTTYETAYNPDMGVEEAYEYLKQLPQFKDAADI